MRQETLCQTATRIHVDFGDSSVFLLQVWPWRLGCRWKCPAYRQLWLLLLWLLWNLSPPSIFSHSQWVVSDDLSDPKKKPSQEGFCVFPSLDDTIDPLSNCAQVLFSLELPPDTADCPVACSHFLWSINEATGNQVAPCFFLAVFLM